MTTMPSKSTFGTTQLFFFCFFFYCCQIILNLHMRMTRIIILIFLANSAPEILQRCADQVSLNPLRCRLFSEQSFVYPPSLLSRQWCYINVQTTTQLCMSHVQVSFCWLYVLNISLRRPFHTSLSISFCQHQLHYELHLFLCCVYPLQVS